MRQLIRKIALSKRPVLLGLICLLTGPFLFLLHYDAMDLGWMTDQRDAMMISPLAMVPGFLFILGFWPGVILIGHSIFMIWKSRKTTAE